MELVKLKTGMPMEFVRYKSSTESIDAVMHEGVTTTIVDPGPATAPLKDGKIRVLAVTSPKRAPDMPDVPTLAEAGVPDVNVEIWAGLFAPSGVPDAIVERLSAGIAKVMQTPEIAARFKTLGMQAAASTPAALRQRVEREIPQWTDVAKRANVHLTQ
jgi:tripartite-type tricarboxylate transporter receptor subunit TctC